MNGRQPSDDYFLFLLGELPGDAASVIESRLESDACARAELEAARIMLAEIDTLLAPPAGSEELAERIIAGLDQVEPRRAGARGPWPALLAVAACLLLAVGVWRFWPAGPAPKVVVVDPPPSAAPQLAVEPPPRVVELAGWRITPTGDAAFEVVKPSLVRLDRGELLIESQEDAVTPLHIETPSGEALARESRFYIGAHETQEGKEAAMFKSLTRVLVLSGVATLTTAMGSVEGAEGDLLAAGANEAPTKLVVQANSDFAWDLYQQLAKENAGENLFFSPYSVSVALAMATEGARGVTAEEMGKMLRYPQSIRRVGDDAQRIPWETSRLHTGMDLLQRLLQGGADDPEKAADIRARMAVLRKEYAAAVQRVEEITRTENWKEFSSAKSTKDKLGKELNQLSSQVDQYEIAIANALWGEQTYPFHQDFVNTINNNYGTGGVFPADFKDNPDVERLNINAWVAGQTKNRIEELLPKRSISKLHRLVLVNAICFKGEWKSPFEEDQTKNRPFTHADGSTTNKAIMRAPMVDDARYGAFMADGKFFDTPRMARKSETEGLYPDADGFALVELPYKGDDLSMVVIAPNRADGLAALEATLTPAKVNAWIKKLKQRPTQVYLPKFTLGTDYKLGDANNPCTLKRMGMQRAFVDPRHPKGARFNGMCASDDPSYRLFVTLVQHNAFIDVNEKGTEAAAASAVLMRVPVSADPRLPFVPEFKADRPFLFLIREKSTGSILFIGRMLDPTDSPNSTLDVPL